MLGGVGTPPIRTPPSELVSEHCGTRYSHGPTGEHEEAGALTGAWPFCAAAVLWGPL